MGFASAIQEWREAERRLGEVPADRQRVVDRVVERIYAELRRRLGSTFTSDELVELYERGTEWAQQLARQTAPDHPWAWEPRLVVDGAFARYLREATDYAGGRRLSLGA
jgi:hypothetical protein